MFELVSSCMSRMRGSHISYRTVDDMTACNNAHEGVMDGLRFLPLVSLASLRIEVGKTDDGHRHISHVVDDMLPDLICI